MDSNVENQRNGRAAMRIAFCRRAVHRQLDPFRSAWRWSALCGCIMLCAGVGCAQILGIEDLPQVMGDGGVVDGMAADASIGTCGDGIGNPGETCDDGNNASGDGCSADCLSNESCGNGYRDQEEACDDGNNFGGDGCSADCLLESCGNGQLDAGEVCDDGNNISADGCRGDCLSREECGNSLKDTHVGEECDTGSVSATCDLDCTLPACGDGEINTLAPNDATVDPDDTEACDPGDGGTDTGVSVNTATCDLDCTVPTCGDNVANFEALNDATADPNDKEQCDSGGLNVAACDLDCTLPLCGDGIANLAANEQCDTRGNTATCDSNCTTPACGDGLVNEAAGEQCEDGNVVSGDGCGGNCQFETCGNGTLDGLEQCDSGVQTGTCDENCTLPECGDGILNELAGEQCDDGNTVSRDGCDYQCLIE